jgi:predicted negative regulator of RcsB-dependent stress response
MQQNIIEIVKSLNSSTLPALIALVILGAFFLAGFTVWIMANFTKGKR